MNFEVFTYNPGDVILTVGSYQAQGWDEISIERPVKAFRLVQGIRGKHVRIYDSNTTATLTVSLMQVSPTNDVFSEIHRLDLLEGTGRIELTLSDKSGNSTFSSEEAFIESYPKKVFKDNIEFVVWTIICQSTDDFLVGGNGRPDNALINEALKLFQ